VQNDVDKTKNEYRKTSGETKRKEIFISLLAEKLGTPVKD